MAARARSYPVFVRPEEDCTEDEWQQTALLYEAIAADRNLRPRSRSDIPERGDPVGPLLGQAAAYLRMARPSGIVPESWSERRKIDEALREAHKEATEKTREMERIEREMRRLSIEKGEPYYSEPPDWHWFYERELLAAPAIQRSRGRPPLGFVRIVVSDALHRNYHLEQPDADAATALAEEMEKTYQTGDEETLWTLLQSRVRLSEVNLKTDLRALVKRGREHLSDLKPDSFNLKTKLKVACNNFTRSLNSQPLPETGRGACGKAIAGARDRLICKLESDCLPQPPFPSIIEIRPAALDPD